MRILMVSMNSIHFQRWTNQLKYSGHEVYWFDIKDGVEVPSLSWVNVFQNWKTKYSWVPKQTFIKKHIPFLYKILHKKPAKTFEDILLQVKPDVVHSFVMYISCVPIFNVMQKHSHVKWIYSSWGSDLFYFKNIPSYRKNIIKVLPRIDYLITDCKRDIAISQNLGFKNKILGTLPGGGGYNFEIVNKNIKPISERKIILVKGYQGRSGRSINVIKALVELRNELKPYRIVVFGADLSVVEYVEKQKVEEKLNIEVLLKQQFLKHEKVLELMGKSLVYIGNSNSDGMPNTLIEAVLLGTFPIQSNPGGASEDIITNNENGFLIQNCESVNQIKNLVLNAITNPELIHKAFKYNQENIKPRYEYNNVKSNVLKAYQSIN